MSWSWPALRPLCSHRRTLAPRCDGCDARLTASTGRSVTPDGLGVLCVSCYVEHTRPILVPAGRAA
jgi:hypothetical protein